MKKLVHACDSLYEDTETHVVIFAGEGKHFCTRADLLERGFLDEVVPTDQLNDRALPLASAYANQPCVYWGVNNQTASYCHIFATITEYNKA